MSAMEEFKKVLEEINAKKTELQAFDEQIAEIQKKTQPIYNELEMLWERKRMAEHAFLMEVENEVNGD